MDLGVVLEFYSARHVFVRSDSSGPVVFCDAGGFGARHQFPGALGVGVWF